MLGLDLIDRRDVSQEAFPHELIHELLAQTLDVHRPPAAEVPQGLADDSRARGIDAAGRDLPLLARDRIAADGTPGRHLEGRRPGWTLVQKDTDDLRDDISSLLDHDRVADADVLAREILVVVQRRPLDRRPGQRDWL